MNIRTKKIKGPSVKIIIVSFLVWTVYPPMPGMGGPISEKKGNIYFHELRRRVRNRLEKYQA